MQLPHDSLSVHSSVIVHIVQHNHSVLAPVPLYGIQVLHQLDQEEAKGLAIGDASVDSVPNFPCACDGGNQIDTFEIRAAGDLIVAQLRHPASLPMVGQLDN